MSHVTDARKELSFSSSRKGIKPWSEFKEPGCFPIAHSASQLMEKPEHPGETANKQLCSIR